MGIQANGMFGGFYKKTGPLIGKRSKGQNLVTAQYRIPLLATYFIVILIFQTPVAN